MKYLKVLNELLFALSNGKKNEVIEFAEEICNLAMDDIQITEYEMDVAADFYEDLDTELNEVEYDR